MNELQWNEAWEHAETAVQADNHLRVWWFNQTDGLLYECETGEIKLKNPVGKSPNVDYKLIFGFLGSPDCTPSLKSIH